MRTRFTPTFNLGTLVPARTTGGMAALALPVLLVGCTDSSGDIDDLVDIGDGRKLDVRCTGTGSPTVLMEGGDDDTTDSYAYAETAVSEVTRTCVYDRANLGKSDPDPGGSRNWSATSRASSRQRGSDARCGTAAPQPMLLGSRSGSRLEEDTMAITTYDRSDTAGSRDREVVQAGDPRPT